MNTLTRAQLTEAIYATVGLSRNESADLLEAMLVRIADAHGLSRAIYNLGSGRGMTAEDWCSALAPLVP